MSAVRRNTGPVALCASVLVLSACGGDKSTGADAALTAAEAGQVAASVMLEISNALSSAGVYLNKSDPGNTILASRGTPTFTINANCASGGKITGSGSYTSNLNSSGTGSTTASATYNMASCVVNTGTRTLPVNGSMSWNFSMNSVNYNQSGNAIDNLTGNLTWPGGSCAMDYRMTFTASGNGSITGSVCGQSINQSF